MKRPKVLVVDDDHIVRTAVSRVLEQNAFQVSVAESGEAALDLCAKEHFDLVILDYEMPKMSGLAAAEIIRTVYDTPFVFLTTHDDLLLARKAIAEGAQSYLVKPVNATELVAQVEVALTRVADEKNLNRAVSETKLINVAIGIAMTRKSLTRQEAFQHLRAIQQAASVKLSQVAASIVDSFESGLRAQRLFERAVEQDSVDVVDGEAAD